LIGTDAYWVQVSIPADQLGALVLPSAGGEIASPAVVRQTVGSEAVEREGKLLRLLGDLDPVGRLVRVLVEVTDPLHLQREASAAALPLLLGAYVSVDFEGRQVSDVAELPRSALHDGDKVFLCGPNDELVIRPVQVSWRTVDTVLVSAGLEPGERLVTSRIATPIAGMKLRTSAPATATGPTATGTGAGGAP
jgi:hypothetical protein